jgi:hypothetical protein
MPIHTDSLSTASVLALGCLIRRLVELHFDPPIYSQEFLLLNYPEWASELSGMSRPEAIALLVAAAKTLQLKMEEKQ